MRLIVGDFANASDISGKRYFETLPFLFFDHKGRELALISDAGSHHDMGK